MKFSPYASIPAEFRPAYDKEERDRTIQNTWNGCWLGALFVPLFYLVDLWKYPEHAGSFLNVRLLCAASMLGFLLFIPSSFGRRHFQFLGLVILLMPSSAIAWMIYMTGEGATSPYYAGLILVLMFLGAVLEWTFKQSVASVVLVWVLFAIACLCSPLPEKVSPEYLGLVVNNVAFLVSTGVVIIVGTYFNGIIRIKEFVQRCEREKERIQREEEREKERIARERERIEREKERKQSLANRIAVLGELNANLQHVINNALTPVGLFLDQLNEKPQENPDDAAFLKLVRAEIYKITGQLNDLKAIATNSNEAPLAKPLDINSTIQEILQRQFSGDDTRQIKIEKQFAAALPSLSGNKTQIEKLFELFLRYEQVTLPKGSLIWLTTEMDTLKGHAAIRVTLKDNGPALPDVVLQHMTDPSTKAPYPSEYGLMLVLISLIVQNHGGSIEASSPASGGNQFIIRLPLQPESDQPAQVDP